ncbi:chromo domain-containing protein 1 [Purpureocillium lavendulum]|uniref:phosphomannomutase n=1 Tax=Purpureocillium lavendulum TaxID=1247861 RepID=A0AB34G461_9HYPO|nr:chromo domain-containing protein 1 [Purpureocillium lavendulum]
MSPNRLRGSRARARPFYVTVLLLSLLTAYAFLTQHGPAAPTGMATPMGAFHSAEDQCAFVRQYCKDDDAGLIPYLDFYYCSLSHAQPVAFVLLVLWLGLLFTTIGIAASDFFSINLSTIATILGLSESLAGVTFLAFGNGSPDVFSTFAAMSSNSPSMAVGELIGAACFITGVVAGSMALVREFRVDRKTYARDLGFFIVAVCFTMAFLADEKLLFWECWAMIGYYILYVVTVVGWHWYSTRRKRRLRREGEARSHFYGAIGQAGDELAGEPYRDEPDEAGYETQPSSRRSSSAAETASFDQGPRIEVDGRAENMDAASSDDDVDGDHERMVAAEVTRNMRILRTGPKRHHNRNPIRPSLFGALEFRSALAHLQRESNLQLSPITGRSYSENVVARARRGTVAAAPYAPRDLVDTVWPKDGAALRRDRALSSGDMPTSSAPAIPVLSETPHVDEPNNQLLDGQDDAHQAQTPTISYKVGGNLAPPPTGPRGSILDDSLDGAAEAEQTPKLRLQIPSRRSSLSNASSPSTPFPRFTESPMLLTSHIQPGHAEFTLLPSPAVARRDDRFPDLQIPVQVSRPVKWWPYSVLPPPHVLLATLFPTLQGWREKTYWDKFASALSVPTIFLLVITLPVVDSETSEEDESSIEGTIVEPVRRPLLGHAAPAVSVEPREIEPEGEWERYRRHSLLRHSSYLPSPSPTSHPLSLAQEDTAVGSAIPASPRPSSLPPKPFSDPPSISNANDEFAPWNRWLVCLQLFSGPLFAVFVLWANLSEEWDDPGRELVKMVLYALLVSLILLAVLLLTTTEHQRPKFHYVLCFLGFIISIAWISTVAGEVVGVLKAFGVILGISEALLGLTIFAAGNSIGDLVADITVARLGYPVMALCACFGGPMLNILLGIGIGGVMMMVKGANRKHKKHPERPLRYGPYPVQVGGTLMISSITLLIMLLLLLILVPLNNQPAPHVPALEERPVKNTICLFDVDGTLTPARLPASPEMLELLQALRQKCAIGFVGGSDFNKQEEQLGKPAGVPVTQLFDFCFSENGLTAYKLGQSLPSNSFIKWIGEDKYKELANFCLHYIADLDIPIKRGTFVEFRNGMINVSPIGRNASTQERLDFQAYDKEAKVREKFVAALKERFGGLGLTFSIGGQISFDVFPTGWDKTYCLKHLENEAKKGGVEYKTIHFFGDKTFEGGNDYEIYSHPATTGHSVKNPEETMAILKELFQL